MYFLVALPAQQCSGRNHGVAFKLELSHLLPTWTSPTRASVTGGGVLLPTQKQSYMSVFVPLHQSLSPLLCRTWEHLALSQGKV